MKSHHKCWDRRDRIQNYQKRVFETMLFLLISNIVKIQILRYIVNECQVFDVATLHGWVQSIIVAAVIIYISFVW